MLQVLTWTATGIGAGWLVRTVMRSRRDYGVLGDFLTGWLGGVIGGWLFRRLGITAPDNALSQIVVALVGAAAFLVALRVLRHVTHVTQVASVAAGVTTSSTFEETVRSLGTIERGIINGLLLRQGWSTDPNQVFDAQSTFGDRVSDQVARFGGSWTFITIFVIVLIGWMAINQDMQSPFDPYPFILLNLVLSCIAALQAPIIMMSQNRQAAKDRSDARNDYEVNVRAEMEIAAVHAKLDLLREQEWHRMTELLAEQQRTLAVLERDVSALRALAPPPDPS
jgi:uncharacterized membrane protein/uncharacterized membrane protein YeaQ/YmgE (transglycosylase-associated protein family)